MIRYSFIIPVKAINDYIRESVSKILAIDRDDYEIIIYPDEVTQDSWPKTRQIASGPGGPAMKRDLAMRDAQGTILVFVDDDAYPEKSFLDVLTEDFKDESIVAVGGPAITPASDSFWQKVSGAVFLSRWSGGSPERYVPVGKIRFIDDWPSVNLSVRKEAFRAVGGFNCPYWPGEDTKLCIDLTKLGTILYDPTLLVYHHRREGLLRHLKQVGAYGIHRGFFAKRFPKTSLKPKYFIPTTFVLCLVVGGFLSIWLPFVRMLYGFFGMLYLSALVFASVDIYKRVQNISITAHALYYVVLTHVVYGVRFAQGFFMTRELKSRLR